MTNEEAPAGQGEGFEITPTPETENEMNSQDTTAPQYTATDVAEALRLIDSGPVPCIDISADDALWQDIAPVWSQTVAELGGTFENLEPVHRALPLDRNGRKVNLPADRIWRQQVVKVPAEVLRYWRTTPNSAIRVGELLIISLGMVIPQDPIEVDGEQVVEFITSEEQRRRWAVVKEQWISDHPEIAASKPVWAETFGVDAVDDDGAADVWFEREMGVVRLSKHAEFRDGALTWDDDSTAPYVTIATWEGLNLDDMLDLVDSLMNTIPFVREVQS